MTNYDGFRICFEHGIRKPGEASKRMHSLNAFLAEMSWLVAGKWDEQVFPEEETVFHEEADAAPHCGTSTSRKP